MKTFLEFLAEMPYIPSSSSHYMVTMEPIHSMRTVKRDYEVIFQTKIHNEDLIYVKHQNWNLYKVLKKIDDDKVLVICQLKFKTKPTIDVKHFKGPIQVDSVYLDEAYRGYGIVTALYALIVKSGHTVISDATQFTPGKELWKKIARESVKLGLKVYVVDGDKHQTYDGENIDDKFIWSTDMDYSKYDVLLIAK